MLLSVIIATYNDAAYVKEAIDSALAQSVPGGHEVIVVDDGSKDHTPEVLAAYGSRIRAIRQENKGLGGARNTGIAAAQGRYCAFLDSDDIFFPWALESMAQALTQFPDALMVVGSAVSFTGESTAIPPVTRRPYQARRFADYWSAQQHMLPSYVAVATEALHRAGGFMEVRFNCEDIDMWFRLGDAGPLVKIDHPVTLARRIRPGSMTLNPDKASKGITEILDRAARDLYPGGLARRRELDRMLYMYARTVIYDITRSGRPDVASRIFRRVLVPSLRQGKLAYVLGMPLYMYCPPLRRWLDARMESRRQAKARAASPR